MPSPADLGPPELVWSLSLERCRPISVLIAVTARPGSGLGDRAAPYVSSGPSFPKCSPMSPARFTWAVKPDLHLHKQSNYMINPLLREVFSCFLKETCATKDESPSRKIHCASLVCGSGDPGRTVRDDAGVGPSHPPMSLREGQRPHPDSRAGAPQGPRDPVRGLCSARPRLLTSAIYEKLSRNAMK